jgi:hypothetical protein
MLLDSTGRETNDRVYLLKFHAGGPKLLFWLQDKQSAEDDEKVAQFNTFMNDPQVVY